MNKSKITAVCESCASQILTFHLKIGMSIECPKCAKPTKIKQGLYRENTGSEIEYGEFKGLLEEKYAESNEIFGLIENWFQYKLDRFEAGFPIFKT